MISKLKELLGIKPTPNYKELLQEGGIIVDVRSKAEFSDGHIKGSKIFLYKRYLQILIN